MKFSVYLNRRVFVMSSLSTDRSKAFYLMQFFFDRRYFHMYLLFCHYVYPHIFMLWCLEKQAVQSRRLCGISWDKVPVLCRTTEKRSPSVGPNAESDLGH